MTLGAGGAAIEQVYRGATVAGLTEGQLLDRFVARRDAVAFEAIVARHGPMVLGVCRRLLRDPNDVDDAFQATFLVLVRKAASLRRRDLLGNWLYGVAYRVAVRARAIAAARGGPEGLEGVPARDEPDANNPTVWEEVARLPEKYRAPVVLCYLEGLTHDEAAGRLGWPVGSVKGRLARARDLLRSRLARRGLAPGVSAATVEALGRPAGASSILPEPLLTTTIKAAGGGGAGAGGIASAQALALSEGVLLAMTLTKLKTLAATLAASVAFLSASGALAYQFGGVGIGADQEPVLVPKAAAESKPAPGRANPPPASSAAKPVAVPARGGMAGMMGMGGGGREARQALRVTIAENFGRLKELDQSPSSTSILDQLDEPLALNFPNETPLEDILKYIKTSTQKSGGKGIPIYVDPIGLQEAECTLTTPVVIDLDGVPLKTTLRLLLKQRGLAYCVRDGVLIISSVEGIAQELEEAISAAGMASDRSR